MKNVNKVEEQMQEIAEWIKKGFTSGKGSDFSWELKIEDLEEDLEEDET